MDCGNAKAEVVHACALAGLPYIGANRLHDMARRFGFTQAWQLVVSGEITKHLVLKPPPGRSAANRLATVDAWVEHARRVDPTAFYQRHVDSGIDVRLYGTDRMPAVLADDVSPPAVLFTHGSLDPLAAPRVAVVGTRTATAYGRAMAEQIGSDLTTLGISVVSGLALGIDGAAHRGAFAALDSADSSSAAACGVPIAVVAGGFDQIYPVRHGALWRSVWQRGLFVSEVPLGGRPHTWRFTQRNRIIAALANCVVIVESREAGGSMNTASHAMARGINVLVVPGLLTNPLSAGPHRLTYDGASVYRNVDDALTAIAGSAPWLPMSPLAGGGGRGSSRPTAPPVSPEAGAVAEALDSGEAGVDLLVTRTGLGLSAVVGALNELEQAGLVRCLDNLWIASAGSRRTGRSR
jgi:DNA processing protein